MPAVAFPSVHELVALAVGSGQRFVEELARAWDSGDAVLPLDTSLPRPTLDRLLVTTRPTVLVDEHGDTHHLDGGAPVLEGDAVVIVTSGSTGDPKGVVHTHDSIAASAQAANAALGTYRRSDRWLCCLPLSHIGGLSVVTRALAWDVPVEVLTRFDARDVEAAALERGATLTSLVPTTLGRIDPGLFRKIVVGGSAMPPSLPPNAVGSYGMTETGSAVVYDGVPLPGAEVAVVDGQILVRGPMLMRAYRDGTDPRNADGWFATDDSGEWDSHGRLVVHGRRGDVINTGGEKVWPAVVEGVLAVHPAVREVAVVGRPDPEWGEIVTAVVVPADPTRPPVLAELRHHVKARLPPSAAPRALVLVDELPRAALGKVRRDVLDPAPGTNGEHEE